MLTQYRFKETQKLLLNYFSKRIDIFWKKKIPKGETYSYDVHDPFEVFGDDTLGFEKFYLVGENWVNNSEKDIVIVLGCNDWKFGFIADYLQDYRVAFAGRKDVNLSFVMKLFKLKIKPKAIVIWGYTESRNLSKYLKITGYDIWRMEDGFIRSASLGASHSTPYSMVIDKTGLYFNNNNPSDLENILNNYNFSENLELLEHSKELLDYVIEYKISKYNPPIVNKSNTIKTKKRVLVIGQVDGDASLRYGNPNKWTMEDMVRLAKYENPSAEILYRPHPEVYKGYQETKFRKKKVEYFAEIVSPDEHIIELIERVDHVYTITSLTGLEALLRNKKVTVLGTPFYAGWGLTDDRSDILRRGRSLSLLELFAGCYILYPNYLSSEDKCSGAMSAILKILADQQDSSYYKNSTLYDETTDKFISLALVIKERKFDLVNNMLLRAFCDNSAKYSNCFIPLLLLSLAKNDADRCRILNNCDEILSISIFNEILLLLEKYNPGLYLMKYWNSLFLKEKQFKLAYVQLHDKYNKISQEHEKTQSTDQEVKEYVEQGELYCQPYFEERYKLEVDAKHYIDAQKTLNHMVLNTEDFALMIRRSIALCESRLDMSSVRLLSKLLKSIDIYYGNRVGVLEEFRTLSYLQSNQKDSLVSMSCVAMYKPDKIFYTSLLLSQLYNVDKSEKLKRALYGLLPLDTELSTRKINGYIAIEEFEKAEKLALKLCQQEEGKLSEGALICYSQALSYNNKIGNSILILESYIKTKGVSKAAVTELLRLYVLNSEYEKSYILLNQALANNLEIGEMHRRKCYFGNKLVGEALKTFKDLSVANNLSIYFSDKFSDDKIVLQRSKSIFILSIFGPGDEIRFASIYSKMLSSWSNSKILIACSPRLKSLFMRSFPSIHFIDVAKPRNGDLIELANYSKLPGSDISTIVDNSAMEYIEKSDRLSVVTSLLSEFIKDYTDFSGNAYLKPDDNTMQKYEKKLKHSQLINVGLSWRSGLTTSARNEHYLSIEELEPLFNIPNIQFVNLQYDECSSELEWVNKRYPGKIINFEELDQYNDFDGVAALMSCLDLVIAPATTVAELAGAIGVKTWLFSNSSEIDWRKTNNIGTDVWHKSVTIVDVADKGNKEKLVEEIHLKLKSFVEAY